jgi:hypothetical protein
MIYYDEAIRIQKRYIFNRESILEAVKKWPILLEALEPERRFKSWNKTNVERVKAFLQSKKKGVDYVSFGEKPYGLSGYRLGFSYSFNSVSACYPYAESIRNEWAHVDVNTKSGEEIYQAVKKHIESNLEYYSAKVDSVKELQEFFADFQLLQEKYPCFERGIRLLTDRHVE